ncbi:unnamed protein product [Penicillium salamii]|uniref:Uncharacterized protein n=1 Tax=Penicillium salamii TaxID=1612424 RepID=A0A9W4NDG0_9EURO|nr:unnamed protein product [Penicillium salamii]
MRLVLSVLVCIFVMLLAFRPLAVDTVIKNISSRTLGLTTLFHAEPRNFSNRPVGELLGSAPDFAQCKQADHDTYRQIFIKDDQESLDYTFGLLMNIVRRPCLGHLVKKIEYMHRPQNHEDYPILPYQRELATDDMHLLKRAVENAGFQGGKEHRIISMLMQNKLSRDSERTTFGNCWAMDSDMLPTFVTQAIAAIIVSLSPNLETMAMTQIFRRHFELEQGKKWGKEFPLVEVFRYANSRPEGTHFLQKLRDVYLINHAAHADSRYFADTDLIACLELFNKLPSIESFEIDVLESDGDHGKQTCEEKSSNISKIKINHSLLNSNYLLCVMKSIKTLEELQFTTGGRATLDGTPFFSPKAFLKGLAEHTRTLKILDLDTEEMTIGYPGQKPSCSYVNWGEYGGPGDYEFDADDELDENDPELAMYRYITSIWDRDVTLKEFVALESLSISIGSLVYLAQGVEMDDSKRASVMLVDCLPDNLRSLHIRGYQKGESKLYDEQVNALMARFESGSLRLEEIKGVHELIPNGRQVENPDNNEHLLWSLEDLGYPEW